MKISFVVPIYKKKPEQVERALKSLVEQSHRDLEIIAVFDGPDAALEDLVAKIPRSKEGYPGDVPFKTIVRPARGGAPAARNTGLDNATGDLVSFWDADCYAEPEMAERWIKEFTEKPTTDFVYSGYSWTDPSVSGFPSELFDPWVLNEYNYIASMFPIRRDKCPRWDETLEGLQDWDFWRRAVQSGCKGQFIPGYAFTTDMPDDESISGRADKTKERVIKIRTKHNDPEKDVMVCGIEYKFNGIGLAKVLDANYFYNPFYIAHEYKVAIAVGMGLPEMPHNMTMLLSAGKNAKKVIYWMGSDAEAFQHAPFKGVKDIVGRFNKEGIIHWTTDKKTREILENMGLEANKIEFPHLDGTITNTLPKDFRILIDTDASFAPFVESLIKAMPDIPADVVLPEQYFAIDPYTVNVQITQNARMGEGQKNFLRQARYVISNVEAPYAGYINVQDAAKAKAKIVRRIREIKAKRMPNLDAQKYYMMISNPDLIRGEVLMLKATLNPPVKFNA